nr:immunoglobulin light chain junction region [Macaca mulatta]
DYFCQSSDYSLSALLF